jgi:DNA repair exonuclease SbcCD nuclease subunit
MLIALVTDQHFGVRGSSTHFLDYFERFYQTVFFPILKERGIDTVIDLGDTFDVRKNINFLTLKRSKEMWFGPLKEQGIKLHSLVGNHTAFYKSTNEVNSMDLLVGQYPNITVYSEPKEVTFDGCDILMMPWINSENQEQCLSMLKSSNAQIMMGHFEIVGCLMDRDIVNDHGMKISEFSRYDMVLSGHFHHKSSTKNIEYLGSEYEMTWADYNDTKGFHIFDTETRELEFIKNPYKMFHKIWYDDEGKSNEEVLEVDFEKFRGCYVKIIKQTVNNHYLFDLFCDRLFQVDPVDIQIVDDHLNLNLIGASDIVDETEDTLEILTKYVNEMPEQNKDELNKLMRSLYLEALQMDS